MLQIKKGLQKFSENSGVEKKFENKFLKHNTNSEQFLKNSEATVITKTIQDNALT